MSDELLSIAARDGNLAGVQAALRAGANLEATSNGATPLHWAANNGHAECVRELAKAGANLEAKCSENAGATPLISAAVYGHAECVRELAKAGAQLEATNNGWTPLHSAAYNGHAECVRELAKAGANLEATNNGKTPLLWAVVRGHAECVRELAEAGANLGPIGDWLDQPGLGLLPYLPSLSEKLGVKYPDDLPGITKEDLKAIGMKPVEITRFIAAAQKLKAPSIPSSAAPVAGSIPFQPRPFPSLGASPAQKAGHGEALATMHMRAFGFHDAVVSGCAKRGEFPNDWSGLLAKAIAYVNEKDGGIDICASGAVAQVKSEFAGKPIGEPILRDFYGAASKGHTTQRRLFYAGPRGYSPEAAKWAGETDIALFTFTDQGVVSPENDLARDLVSAAQPSGAAGANKHKRSAPAGPCTGWRKEQVQQWLESCEFEAFAGSFSIVDGSDLKGLTAADLATLQPPILGFSAKKLLQAIRQLEPIEV